nr:ribonuclease H-like domain-containing protein [Tanacetum cinerariifolium]
MEDNEEDIQSDNETTNECSNEKSEELHKNMPLEGDSDVEAIPETVFDHEHVELERSDSKKENFTRDNNCTIEFEAFGFSVKDYLSRHILLRCDSSGDLYPVTKPSTPPIAFLSTSASKCATAPPITDPNQSPTHIGLNSPSLTFPTNQPTSHEPHNTQTQTQTQNSPLPPSIFDPPNPQTNTDPVNEPSRTHLMITRSQSGILKPIDRLSLNTFLISPIPKNPFDTLKDPQWCNAMYDEYNTLVKNDTWLLVPRPAGVNMVRSMWLFKHKFHDDGTLSRYKARLVANGSSQQLGVDFDEAFSPVVKPATIRTVLSLVVSRKWPIHQLDVKNAFLNGDLSETVYIHQPPGFVDVRQGPQVAYLLLYVDDIILTASSTTLLQQLIDSLHREFDMTNLGALNYFFGISAIRHSTGLFLSQRKYDVQLFERTHMVNCNPSQTPVDTEFKLGPDGVSVQDPTMYRSLAWGLQYFTFTRPDLSYAVQQICLYMHDPREPHLVALKRILRYVQGTLDLGLHLYASSTTFLVGYTNADWAGFPSTRRSTSGYCVFLGDNLLSWSAKRQHTLSRSSAESEYRGVANVGAETAWLCNLLRELHSPSSTVILVYFDNISVVYMFANPVQHQRMKHIEIDIHFVRDMVTAGQVRVLHVPSRYHQNYPKLSATRNPLTKPYEPGGKSKPYKKHDGGTNKKGPGTAVYARKLDEATVYARKY